MNTSETSFFANNLQVTYEPKLLEHAVKKLIYDQFAIKRGLAPNSSSKTLRFRRRCEADLNAVGAPKALTEGVAPTEDRDVSYENVDITLGQRGQISKTTDVLDALELLQVVKDTVSLMGDECALDADSLMRNQLSHPTTGLRRMYTGGAADFAALKAKTANEARMTPKDLLRAAAQLKTKKAPTINGVYVAVIPPAVEFDILNHPDWKEIVRYQNANKLFKGEIGDFGGIRLVRHDNPFREDAAEGTYDAAGEIFTVHVLGATAYGCADMAKLGGFKPKMIILDKPDKSDPLGQLIKMGWKSFWGSGVLNRNYGISLRCKSEFVEAV